MDRQRTSSTIPYGYELDEDGKTLKPIEEQLNALRIVADLVKDNTLSLRDACLWVEHQTGRSLSHTGLRKIIDNGRLDQEPRELSEG